MFSNYLKTAWRNLMKNKVFSFVNILGLTIGITVCMMIFLFIMNEFSVDNFHKNGNHIYRVMRNFKADEPAVPYLSGPYAPALLNDFKSDIKNAVRVMPSDELITFGNTSFNEKNVYLADSNFFSFFSFPLLRGNTMTALREPGSAVLSETTAKKYFGNIDNAMGKVITMDSFQLKITGIARDVSANSHLDFNLVVPLSNYLQYDFMKGWINNNLFTYVQLNEHTNVAQLEKKFVPFVTRYMGHNMQQYGYNFSLTLTPLRNIYFEDASAFDNVKHGDKTVVYIFLSIALLLLLIACVNFMNLSTIRAVERSKEVGLRKVLGALRNNLVWQFIGESILFTAISCLLSIVLLYLCMPLYIQLLGYPLAVSWNGSPIYLFLIGVIIVVGFLAGCYPAFFLSAFSPIQALKGKLRLGKEGSTFRQALVVVQFAITVFLIVGTIAIRNQMHYVKNKQLGYNKEQVVVVPISNNDFYKHRFTFKKELQNNSNIASLSLMSGEPGGFFGRQAFEVEGQHVKLMLRTERADFEYVKTLGLTIVAGRDFSSQFPTDTTSAVLINETAAKKLGWTSQQAVGKWIRNAARDSVRRNIVGVVKDFNFLSLKETMDGLVVSPSEDRRVVMIKLKEGNIEKGIAAIKKAYTTLAPQYPFEYSFLDEKFNDLYRNDLRQQTIISVFAGLAIFVACLGLFGLASFMATRRFKEIGVRKVLGSSVQGIVVLLLKDLLKPVVIATCIALPVGHWAMSKWLQNFAYKTTLNWWIFLLAALIALGIALITVSIKAIKAAMTNPVVSLKSE